MIECFQTKDRLKQAFCKFDFDGDGSINLEQFAQVWEHLGIDGDPDQVTKTFALIDDDHSNRIEYEVTPSFQS